MKDENKIILEKINYQKSELKKWKDELKEDLSKNLKKEIECYIINNNWMEEYKKLIFSDQLNESEKIEKYKKFELIDNYKFIYSNKIQELDPIFILKEDLWSSFIRDKSKEISIKIKGYLGNKILFFILNTKNQNVNVKIYCFFFLDENKILRQGYIKINENDLEKDIINKLENDTPLNFLKEKNIKYKIDIFQNWYYLEIIIYDLKNIVKKNESISTKDMREIIKNSIDEIKHGFKKPLYNSILSSITPNDNFEIDNNPFDSKRSVIINLSNEKKQKTNKEIEEIFNPKTYIKKKIRPKSPESTIKRKKKINFDEILNLMEYIPNKVVKKLSSPGIIGLQNIGAICYMNATLQCLSNITRLRLALLDKEKYKELEKGKNSDKKLSFALAEVLKNLWKKLEQRFYAPENFKKVISEVNGIATNEPKDLILFLLETMHKELKYSTKSQNPDNNNKITNIYNYKEIFNYNLQYNSSKQSIITEEFYGYTNNMSICTVCKATIHNVQLMNIIFFPLEEIRNFKNYQFNFVSIIDCFEYYIKYDFYPNFDCNICKNKCQVCGLSRIAFAPKTLIVNLNRGIGLQFKVDIIFEEYLNIKKYVIDKDSPYYYELIGVISHYGSNDVGEHFIAYCKNSNNCEWYKYNDEIVTKCSFSEVKSRGIPYILFYSYIVDADRSMN